MFLILLEAHIFLSATHYRWVDCGICEAYEMFEFDTIPGSEPMIL